jgi:hypothetical protein
MAQIDFFAHPVEPNEPAITVTIGPGFADPPRCLKCGAEEGEPHTKCSSPYLLYSASKTRNMTKDNIRPVNSLA